ncbi:MAG: arylsulfatase [Bryobacterales bacterium]
MRVLVFALALLAACASPPVERKPNFIVILTDDQGYGDIGVHGNSHIRTPNLDRFASQAVELSRFYVEPVCAPTRAALMTGRYHYRTGVIHTSRGGAKMHGDETTIAERLRDAGYRTGMFGKWHLGDNYPMRPHDQGFELALWHKSGGIGQSPDIPNSYFDPHLWRNGKREQAQGYCTDVFFREALKFVEEHRGEPFFVYLPTNAPHTPLEVADELWKPYADAGLDETTARVYGMVENIDENVGRLLGKLDELGLAENTYVVFLSDNGPQQKRYTAGLRGRKSMNYEGGIRALSFWRGPGLQAKKTDRIAAHIDVAPTLLDLAGLPAADGLDGRSLRPLLEGEPEHWERTHFSQVHRGLEVRPYQNTAVNTERWTLVLGPGTFGDESWSYEGEPPLELYDAQADPGEEHDVAGDQPDVVAELKGRYQQWFADVKSTRNFTPGVIHLGSQEENPAVLCRYQDATFVDGHATTWPIEIERGGRYRLRINEAEAAGQLHVLWQGAEQTAPGVEGEFELAAGAGPIDIWFQPRAGERPVYDKNEPKGDVTVERLD